MKRHRTSPLVTAAVAILTLASAASCSKDSSITTTSAPKTVFTLRGATADMLVLDTLARHIEYQGQQLGYIVNSRGAQSSGIALFANYTQYAGAATLTYANAITITIQNSQGIFQSSTYTAQ